MTTTTMTTNTAPLSQADARELTDQIAEGLADVHSLIVQAWEGRVWEALGIETWDAWIDQNFRGLQLRPPREQREEVVLSMREAGMSVRAISRATDLGIGTIHRAAAGVPNGTPEQESVGLDGKSYSARKPEKPADESSGSMTLTDLGVPPIDRSTLRQAKAVDGSVDVEAEALSGDVVEPEGESDSSASWWEGPREALLEAESRCAALLKQRKAEPRLTEDPQDPGTTQLTMAAARSVLAAGGVIVDLGVNDLDGESQEALRRVLGTVIESLDGVIGDLEDADDDEA